MRLFFAIAVPDRLASTLFSIRREIPQEKSWRWVRPELFHLTLRFYGECDEQELSRLLRLAEQAASRVSPFTLTCRGVGTFGRGRNPRVLWAGLAASQRLSRLTEALASGAETAEETHHLTLARRRRGSWGPFSLPDELKERAWGEWAVEEFVLMESELTQAGPVYHQRGVWGLRGGT